MLFRRTARLALVLSMLLLLAPVASYGNETTPAALSYVYLPLIQVPGRTAIQFASSLDPLTNELVNPRTTFSAGIDYLYVGYTIQGFQGSTYRLDFTFANGEKLAGSPYTVTSSNYKDVTAYCFTRSGSCELGREPLPPGVYTARLYLDGNLFSEAQATVQ